VRRNHIQLQNKQVVNSCSRTQNISFILILMATCFGPSDHHLAILQNLKVRAVQPRSMGSHKTYNYINIYAKRYKCVTLSTCVATIVSVR